MLTSHSLFNSTQAGKDAPLALQADVIDLSERISRVAADLQVSY